MNSISTFDIAICGAGPIGLSAAALLLKRGISASRMVLIDAKEISQTAQDPRSIALSWGSRQILQEIGVWDRIAAAAQAIHQIHVSRRGHFGRTLIQREQYHLPALGYVTRYGSLISALHTVVDNTAIHTIRPAKIRHFEEQDQGVTIQLVDGSTVNSQMVIQAEGGVFSEQTAKTLQHDYKQTAIIAHVNADAAIAHRAFERFTNEGPLALLPQDNGYAMVWCVRPNTAAQLLALDDNAFLSALQQTFGERVGHFDTITARSSYPLGLNAVPALSKHIVAIGNAAQTLHPVAGQGLNLGLRDATVLARLLSSEISTDALKQFAIARKSDRHLTIKLTDIMARLFAGTPEDGPSQTLLGMSLGLLDSVAPAKRLLAEHMLFGWR